jgi:hypothetical protein
MMIDDAMAPDNICSCDLKGCCCSSTVQSLNCPDDEMTSRVRDVDGLEVLKFRPGPLSILF